MSWQIGSSATLGTGTDFVGNIVALTSITLVTGSTLTGRALARNGAVTLDNNLITVPDCALPPTSTSVPTSTLTPTNTPIPTNTPTPTNTPIPTNTRTPTNIPTVTPTPIPPGPPGVGGFQSGQIEIDEEGTAARAQDGGQSSGGRTAGFAALMLLTLGLYAGWRRRVAS